MSDDMGKDSLLMILIVNMTRSVISLVSSLHVTSLLADTNPSVQVRQNGQDTDIISHIIFATGCEVEKHLS